MSLGPLMVGLSGVELTAEEREMLIHPMVGAVILFSRNFESAQQVQATSDLLDDGNMLNTLSGIAGNTQQFRDEGNGTEQGLRKTQGNPNTTYPGG